MQLEYLREFIEIANTRSISGAARKLNISQPVLSKHVQVLEKELDAQLLERTPSSVGLTRAGRLFLSSAEEVLSVIENLKTRLAEEGSKDEVVVCGNTRPHSIRNLVASVAREVPYGVRFATGPPTSL